MKTLPMNTAAGKKLFNCLLAFVLVSAWCFPCSAFAVEVGESSNLPSQDNSLQPASDISDADQPADEGEPQPSSDDGVDDQGVVDEGEEGQLAEGDAEIPSELAANYCGVGVQWTLANGVLTVSGNGQMYDYTSATTPWASSASQITSVRVNGGVGTIGTEAFRGLPNLTSVTLDSGVQTIRSSAFADCPSLSVVNYPASARNVQVNAFGNCPNLSTVRFAGSWNDWVSTVNTYGYATCSPCNNGAALYCNGSLVTSATIPAGTTSVLAPILCGVTSVTSVTVPDSVSDIGTIVLAGCPAVTAAGNCGSGLSYVLHSNGLLQVCGNGTMTSFTSASSVPWSSYAGNITQIHLSSNVKSIGNYAFSGCSRVNEIAIPSGVTFIGRNAFNGCSSLTSVALPGGLSTLSEKAFYGCSSLANVSLGANITSMGSQVFSGCGSIREVRFAGTSDQWISVASHFADYTCNPCYNGANLYMNGTLLTQLVVSDGVTAIPDFAFYGVGTLASVSVPLSVTSVGASSFVDCPGVLAAGPLGNQASYLLDSNYKLQLMGSGSTYSISSKSAVPWYSYASRISQVDISSGLTSIPGYSFSGCTALTQVVVPQGVSVINDKAFDGCTNLSSITIPASITRFGSSCFNNCRSLKSVYYQGTLLDWLRSVGSLSNLAANPCNNGASLYLNGARVTNLVIPDSVTIIPNYAFANVTSVTSVTIPDGVVSVGSASFQGVSAVLASGACGSQVAFVLHSNGTLQITGRGAMTNYTSGTPYTPWRNLSSSVFAVTVSPDVTSIGNYAFSRCTALNRVSIPEGVQSVGKYAFMNCTSLRDVVLPDSITAIGDHAFYNSGLVHITLPANLSSISDYSFYGCDSLNAVDFPDSLTTIGNYAFFNGYALAEIDLPEGLTSIGNYAFYYNSSLGQAILPKSLSSVGDAAFMGDSNLRKVMYRGSQSDRNSIAFGYDNESLTNATWAYDYGTFGSNPHFHEVYRTETSGVTCTTRGIIEAYCSCGEYLGITGYVDALGHDWDNGTVTTAASFQHEGVLTYTCRHDSSHTEAVAIPALTSISGTCGSGLTWTLEDTGVLTISGTGAMAEPSGANGTWKTYKGSITKVVINEGVTSVNGSAFLMCPRLNEVNLPNSIQTLAAGAFQGCSALNTVNFAGNAPSIAATAFTSCGAVTAHYPATELTWVPSKLVGYGASIAWIADGAELFQAGDVNLDGKLDMRDQVLLQRCLAGGVYSAVQLQKADFDGNGVVNRADLTALASYLLRH